MKITSNQLVQVTIITLLLLLWWSLDASGQCPMCRTAAETNLKNGGTAAAGLNKGIIYLLSIPYILVSTLGFLWWRNRRLLQEQEQEDEIRALLEPLDISMNKDYSTNA